MFTIFSLVQKNYQNFVFEPLKKILNLVTRTPTVISYAISFIELKIIMHIMYIVNYNLCSLLAVLQ